jgi:cell division protein FtsI/penicillin-binding protein 2
MSKVSGLLNIGGRPNTNLRIRLLGLAFVVLFIAIISRLYYVQVYRHDYYMSKSLDQYKEKNIGIFERGKIYIQSKNGLKTVIAQNVDEEYEKDGQKYVRTNRIYPLGDLTAKVVGYLGYVGDYKAGLYGVEKYYNDVLSRESNGYTNFFAELFGEVEGSAFSDKPIREGDVTLTLDIEAQRYLHKVLIDTQEKWHSDTIGGIVMDPNTGKIVAMDELPTYDPNKYSEFDIKNYQDQLVSGSYEMGSIMKPLTMAAALDSDTVAESTTYNDTGCRTLNTMKVCNYDHGARGVIPMQTILDKSLNVGIVFLIEKMGSEKFASYFKKFGFGKETGIDLPSETPGLASNLNSSVFVDVATAGFGQGYTATPIQTIRALATLGNGGKLVNPYIVESITYTSGKVKVITPNEPQQILEASTSERISRMLTHVVDTALLNGSAKMEHYSIAAKTGTAQMVNPYTKKYYDDRYLHSFFGYFPSYDPKYIIFLYHTYPKGAQYASATLSDPFFDLTKFLISYYEIPPDR